jgi:hypothetical protein
MDILRVRIRMVRVECRIISLQALGVKQVMEQLGLPDLSRR